jgi:hypothetical protein
MKGTHNIDENDECNKCEYQKGPHNDKVFNISHDGTTKVNIDKGPKKGTAIYRFKLKESANGIHQFEDEVACYYTNSVSGICRFVEDLDEDTDSSNNKEDKESKNNVEQEKQLKRFIILNFHGIYDFKFNCGFKSFKLNKRLKYPKSIRYELNSEADCMNKLLTRLYDQYFLVERYKNDEQVFEGKYYNIKF